MIPTVHVCVWTDGGDPDGERLLEALGVTFACLELEVTVSRLALPRSGAVASDSDGNAHDAVFVMSEGLWSALEGVEGFARAARLVSSEARTRVVVVCTGRSADGSSADDWKARLYTIDLSNRTIAGTGHDRWLPAVMIALDAPPDVIVRIESHGGQSPRDFGAEGSADGRTDARTIRSTTPEASAETTGDTHHAATPRR